MKFKPRDLQDMTEVIDHRIERRLAQEPRIEYGSVASVAGAVASVYLLGSAIASPGFHIPPRMTLAAGQRVRVVINPNGDRYIDENLSAAPSVVQTQSIELGPEPAFIDFKTPVSDDYDARIIYWPATEGDALRIKGKNLHVDQALQVDGSGSVFDSPPGHTVGNGDATLGGIEVYNANTTTGDAYLTFHNPNRFAAHFGLDGATNDLFFGGWSRGAKYRVHHNGNYTALKYTAITEQDVVSAWVNTSDANDAYTPEATSIPVNTAVLVTGRVYASCTAGGSSIDLKHASTGALAGSATVATAGPAYTSAFLAVPGSTNGRCLRFNVRCNGGTITYYIQVSGYFYLV